MLDSVNDINLIPQLETLDPKLLNNTQYAKHDLLLFNRVPKVGSEHMSELIKQLGVKNNFQANRIGLAEPILAHLSIKQERNWTNILTNLGDSQSFSMHASYMDFRFFNKPQPIYMNMIRDPVERVISWFYYIRTPWRLVQQYKVNKKFFTTQFYKKDFTECVLQKDLECLFIQDANFKETMYSHIRQTLFFCGNKPECEPFNSKGALQRAKHIVETEFAVVGSWEDVNVTLKVLENYIPKYFRGVTELYYEDTSGLYHEKRNSNPRKLAISEEIKNILRRNFTREYEFYYFCKQRLYKQYLALENL